MNRREHVPWSRLGLAAFLCAILLTPGHLATPDAHLRLAQARNLVTNGSVAIPDGVGNPNHGNLAPGRRDEMHSVYNPGHILLLAPVYAVASNLPAPADLHPHYSAAFGASFLGLLAHFSVSLVLFAVLLRLGRSRRRSLIVAALFAFATISLPSASDGYDHTFEALAIVLALFFLVDDEKEEGATRPVVAGLVLGAGVLFRYTVLLALPGLLLIARDHRSRLRLLLGLMPAIGIALFYNHHRFGSVFETGYPAAWRLAHGTDIGETGFQLESAPKNLAALLASPGKGLLWFCPVVAVAAAAWGVFRRNRPRIADGIAVTALLYLVFYAANFAWHGSVWSWGPRYLVPITAPVIMALAYLPGDRTWRTTLLVAGLISVTVQAASIGADHRRYLVDEQLEDPRGFEERILYEPVSSPILGQFESVGHVVPATLTGGDFRPFIAAGPWKSVARPASREMMLEQSTDFNVVDLWWIRLPFFTSSTWVALVSVLLGGLIGAGTAWNTGYLWQAVRDV